jgi:uncharacterized metal-binding protein YceD (DUF177 family)
MMDSLQPYILPLKGLGDGTHEFSYLIDGDFFRAFPDAPVEKSEVAMRVTLEKRPNLLVFEFSFTGWVASTCDRCLVPIQLPVSGENQLLVKYGEPESTDEKEDVVYIPAETSNWSIAQYAYEYVLLSLPLIKVYACEEEANPPCDFDTLDRLEGSESDEAEKNASNPFRDALKDWDKNQENS